jgi:hypothetical protein
MDDERNFEFNAGSFKIPSYRSKITLYKGMRNHRYYEAVPQEFAEKILALAKPMEYFPLAKPRTRCFAKILALAETSKIQQTRPPFVSVTYLDNLSPCCCGWAALLRVQQTTTTFGD